jgi:hypothetical protein
MSWRTVRNIQNTSEKSLNLFSVPTRITDIDEDNVNLTIRHYNEDVDDKLVKKCCRFQVCLKSVSAHDSLEYQTAYSSYLTQNCGRFPQFDNSPTNLRDITDGELWSWKKLL